MSLSDALLRFPLRVGIPLALILFACLTSVFLAAYNFTRVDAQVEGDIHERVVQLMTRTQGTLRNLSRKGDVGGMQLEVSQLGSDPLVISAALLDEADTIMQATRYSLVGKNLLNEVPGLTKDRLDDVRKRHVGEVTQDSRGDSYLAFYPVELWAADGELGSATAGLLFIQYDLHSPQAHANRLLLQQIVQFSLLIGAFSIMLWLMFHFSLTRRVDHLMQSANRFGQGDMTVRAGLTGHDEIARLGSAFDNMVDVIVEDRRRLADSEGRMRAILDNVSECIITTNDHGMIQSVNPALERMFGYKAEQVTGRHLSILFTDLYQRIHDNYIADSQTNHDPQHHFTSEAFGLRKNRSEIALEVTASDFVLGNERLFVWIMRDITERKKVDRMKDEFVSVVSHELRTPLTSILGSLGLLNSGVMGDLSDQAQQMLTIAQNNSERLVRLINDILDIEKIESGELSFTGQRIDLAELVRQSVDANRGFGEKYSVTFVIEESLSDTYVQGDHDRLMQVLANLLSNAAKYSPAQGTVYIGMIRKKHFVSVTVRDEGPGIPDAFRDRIFEKFAQVDSSDTRQKDGTGLGLSIARSIVELHGGIVGFTSPACGGTEFFFDLPECLEDLLNAG